MNEERIYSHEYKPAAVWLHKYFDAIVNCYLPKRFQRIGENILTLILKRGEAKIDFIELREILPGGNMWLFGNLRSAVNVLRVKEGVYPLNWIDFDCCNVGHHEIEVVKGRRILPDRWAKMKELYTNIRLKPMSNIWGIPKWNSKYVMTGKASNPIWRSGCGKIIHFHDYWVGGDLVDYDVWEDFITWHVKQTRDWVKLYRGLGEWDAHWFGNGGSWKGFFEYTLRYGRAIKRNNPNSYVILSGNHTWDYVGWDAETHGLPKKAWPYYEKLTDNKDIFKWIDALGYHPYEYNNSNPNSPWIAAEHLRTLLDRKELYNIEVAVDEWGHDLGYKFVRNALPGLIHNGVVNIIMVDWNLVEGEHQDRFGLIFPDGEVKNREVFECWMAWSELFHGARRYWNCVRSGHDISQLYYATSIRENLITTVLDNLGEKNITLEITVPLNILEKEYKILIMEPSLKHLVLITEDKPEIIESEAIFEIEVPAKGIRIVKLIPHK